MKNLTARTSRALLILSLLILTALIVAANHTAVAAVLAMIALVLCIPYALSTAKSFTSDPYIHFDEADLSRREVVAA